MLDIINLIWMITIIENVLSSEVVTENKQQPEYRSSRFSVGFHVFLPVAGLILVILGRRHVFDKILLQLDRRYLTIFCPCFIKREALVKWAGSRLPPTWSSHSTKTLSSGIKELWADGSLLCTLINTAVPGACPNPHRHWKQPPTHAQALAYKYFGVTPVFTKDELTKKLNSPLERKFVSYLTEIQQAVNKFSENSEKESKISERYIVRGMGLYSGEQFKTTVFYVYLNEKSEDDNESNIIIQIKGPFGTYGEAISPKLINRKRRFRRRAKAERRSSLIENLQSLSWNFKKIQKKKECEEIEMEATLENNRIEVRYVPKYDGMYEINMIAGGELLKGCPFNVHIFLNDTNKQEVLPKKSKHPRIVRKVVDAPEERMPLIARHTIKEDIIQEETSISIKSSFNFKEVVEEITKNRTYFEKILNDNAKQKLKVDTNHSDEEKLFNENKKDDSINDTPSMVNKNSTNDINVDKGHILISKHNQSEISIKNVKTAINQYGPDELHNQLPVESPEDSQTRFKISHLKETFPIPEKIDRSIFEKNNDPNITHVSKKDGEEDSSNNTTEKIDKINNTKEGKEEFEIENKIKLFEAKFGAKEKSKDDDLNKLELNTMGFDLKKDIIHGIPAEKEPLIEKAVNEVDNYEPNALKYNLVNYKTESESKHEATEKSEEKIQTLNNENEKQLSTNDQSKNKDDTGAVEIKSVIKDSEIEVDKLEENELNGNSVDYKTTLAIFEAKFGTKEKLNEKINTQENNTKENVSPHNFVSNKKSTNNDVKDDIKAIEPNTHVDNFDKEIENVDANDLKNSIDYKSKLAIFESKFGVKEKLNEKLNTVDDKITKTLFDPIDATNEKSNSSSPLQSKQIQNKNNIEVKPLLKTTTTTIHTRNSPNEIDVDHLNDYKSKLAMFETKYANENKNTVDNKIENIYVTKENSGDSGRVDSKSRENVTTEKLIEENDNLEINTLNGDYKSKLEIFETKFGIKERLNDKTFKTTHVVPQKTSIIVNDLNTGNSKEKLDNDSIKKQTNAKKINLNSSFRSNMQLKLSKFETNVVKSEETLNEKQFNYSNRENSNENSFGGVQQGIKIYQTRYDNKGQRNKTDNEPNKTPLEKSPVNNSDNANNYIINKQSAGARNNFKINNDNEKPIFANTDEVIATEKRQLDSKRMRYKFEPKYDENININKIKIPERFVVAQQHKHLYGLDDKYLKNMLNESNKVTLELQKIGPISDNKLISNKENLLDFKNREILPISENCDNKLLSDKENVLDVKNRSEIADIGEANNNNTIRDRVQTYLEQIKLSNTHLNNYDPRREFSVDTSPICPEHIEPEVEFIQKTVAERRKIFAQSSLESEPNSKNSSFSDNESSLGSNIKKFQIEGVTVLNNLKQSINSPHDSWSLCSTVSLPNLSLDSEWSSANSVKSRKSFWENISSRSSSSVSTKSLSPRKLRTTLTELERSKLIWKKPEDCDSKQHINEEKNTFPRSNTYKSADDILSMTESFAHQNTKRYQSVTDSLDTCTVLSIEERKKMLLRQAYEKERANKEVQRKKKTVHGNQVVKENVEDKFESHVSPVSNEIKRYKSALQLSTKSINPSDTSIRKVKSFRSPSDVQKNETPEQSNVSKRHEFNKAIQYFKNLETQSQPAKPTTRKFSNDNTGPPKPSARYRTGSLNISEKFSVNNLYDDVFGKYKGSFKGTPNRSALVEALATFSRNPNHYDKNNDSEDDIKYEIFKHVRRRKRKSLNSVFDIFY